MIINEGKRDVVTVGDFATSGFKIAAGAKAFQILSSNIYTHKVRAVLREISCNAYDAHVASNNSEPFEVHLPTYLEPWFSVRDFGTGLSEEDLRTVYTTYFFSTKTQSNDFIGALGLGSKSPFCLVESFSVISYFGGEKKVFNCFKDSNGEPQIALLTSCESDERQGLEVLVPGLSRYASEFEQEAVNVFRFFDRLPNINSSFVVETIEGQRNKFFLQGDGFGFSGDHGIPKAVMGNVAYDIPHLHSNNLGIDGYIRFAIGELSFDPGREKLSLDDMTLQNLERRLKEVSESIAAYAVSQVEQEPTPFLRAKMFQRLMRGPIGVRIRDWSSDAYKQLRSYEMPTPSEPIKVFMKSKKSAYVDWCHRLNLLDENNFYCIDKPRMDRRVRRFVSDTGRNVIAFKENQIEELQIDRDILSDIDSIPKIPYATTKRSNGKPSFRIFNYQGVGLICDFDGVLPDGEKVYVELNRSKPVANRPVDTTIRKMSSIFQVPQIFGLARSTLRTARFLKEKNRGEWIDFDSFVNREIRSLVGDTVMNDPSYHECLLVLMVRKIMAEVGSTDTRLSPFEEFAESYERASKSMEIYRTAIQILPDLSVRKDDSLRKEVEKIIQDFPMLRICHENLHRLSYSDKQTFVKMLAVSCGSQLFCEPVDAF